MNRFHSYLRSSIEIIRAYSGPAPFALYLKEYFRAHPKAGSTDRKAISQACYAYYRTGHSLPGLATDELILAGLFLTSEKANDILAALRPEWNRALQTPISPARKFHLLADQYPGFDPELIFPFPERLGTEIDRRAFAVSHLLQPDLFLRIRPGRQNELLEKLRGAGLSYSERGQDALAFSNSTKLDACVDLDRDAVIQDLSSQRISEFIDRVGNEIMEKPLSLWDCCAGSGGKSILFKDRIPGTDIFVSDSRPSILSNLEKRFRKAGMGQYRSVVLDLRKQRLNSPEKFDCILADVPCSGSGTWGRTPEQLRVFDPGKLGDYQDRQKRIVGNAIPSLKKGGYLLYCTCSVFRLENEEVVAYIQDAFRLSLLESRYLKGYENRADTLFAALLIYE